MVQFVMLDAPIHDWELYEERCRHEHLAWLRGLSPAEGFDLLAGFHEFVAALPRNAAEVERWERARWEEKLAARDRLVAILSEWDQHARRPANDIGGRR